MSAPKQTREYSEDSHLMAGARVRHHGRQFAAWRHAEDNVETYERSPVIDDRPEQLHSHLSTFLYPIARSSDTPETETTLSKLQSRDWLIPSL